MNETGIFQPLDFLDIETGEKKVTVTVVQAADNQQSQEMSHQHDNVIVDPNRNVTKKTRR